MTSKFKGSGKGVRVPKHLKGSNLTAAERTKALIKAGFLDVACPHCARIFKVKVRNGSTVVAFGVLLESEYEKEATK